MRKILFAAMIPLLFSFTCVFFQSTAINVVGKVVDLNTADALVGATVKIASSSGEEVYSATTDSYGGYSISSIAYGEYTVTVTMSGYTGLTRKVSVVADNQVLPVVGAFNSASNANKIKVVTLWDPSFKDVDAWMTAPNGKKVPNTSVWPSFSDSNYYKSSDANTAVGFFPESVAYAELGYNGSTAHRVKVNGYASSQGSFYYKDGTTECIKLEVDNRGLTTQNAGGPETFTISWGPFDATGQMVGDASYPAVSGNPLSLAAGNYFWTGVYQFYVDAFNDASNTGETYDPDSYLSTATGAGDAAVEVYVFYGSTQLGHYTLPEFTKIKTASLLRIHCFMRSSDNTEWFVILPNLQIFKDRTGIRSIDSLFNPVMTCGGAKRF